MSAAPTLKLKYVVEISFKLDTFGLLIRSGKAKEIMGLADIIPVSIEYPYSINNSTYILTVPYIPASSLKGRARSLLETALGLPLYTTDGKIYLHTRIVKNFIYDEDPYCPVDNVFGTPAIPPNIVSEDKKFVVECWAPSRAIFRDLFPSVEYIRRLCDAKGGCEGVQLADFLEEKWENRIDRITSTADPRNIMRLKPGVEFEGKIHFLVYDLDVCRKQICDEKSSRSKLINEQYNGKPALYYLDMLVDSLQLVERTYLGASGTRGYGTVKFKDINVAVFDVGGKKVDGKGASDLGGLKNIVKELKLTCE